MSNFFTEKEILSTSLASLLADAARECDKGVLEKALKIFATDCSSRKFRNASKKAHASLYGTASPFFASENSQYYTKPEVATNCLSFLNLGDYDLIVEPSAGRGDFFRLLPKESRFGLDIDPKFPEIERMDYFNYFCGNRNNFKNILVVGNPPFGKNSKMAVEFFQHSAKYADIIAFVLPRTFRKPSVTNRLSLDFWLRKEVLLDENSFYIENERGEKEDYRVPCVFQVWEKRSTKRAKVDEPNTHSDFKFCDRDEADIAIRRVGVAAGKCFSSVGPDEKGMKTPSHYFIKTIKPYAKDVFDKMWREEFSSESDPDCRGFKYDTSGNPSISKTELVKTYEVYKNKLNL